MNAGIGRALAVLHAGSVDPSIVGPPGDEPMTNPLIVRRQRLQSSLGQQTIRQQAHGDAYAVIFAVKDTNTPGTKPYSLVKLAGALVCVKKHPLVLPIGH